METPQEVPHAVQIHVEWEDEWVTLARFPSKGEAMKDKLKREKHAMLKPRLRVKKLSTRD